MPRYICKSCGVQRGRTQEPPETCPICDDPRQFVPVGGHAWMTPDAMLAEHGNVIRQVAPDLMSICTVPQVAIGQRAFLIRTPAGNVLWDCVSLLDDATIALVEALGGLAAVAVSHPHFYAGMARWGRVFDCPVLVHADDQAWIAEDNAHIERWEGETRAVLPGIELHRIGGHFAGSSVLHWAERRELFAGDTVLVTADRAHVAFMWSYPNNVPLPADCVREMAARLNRIEFDTLRSAFDSRGDIVGDARRAVARSAARHIDPPVG